MSRIYVASSWRNTYQPSVVEALRDDGHEVYDFKNPPHGMGGFAWKDLDPNWEKWTTEAYRNQLLTSEVASHGFMSDFRAMLWADTCVLVMPCGRSAHLELGYMAGAGKRTIILLSDGEPELMNLLANDICVSLAEVRALLEPKKVYA